MFASVGSQDARPGAAYTVADAVKLVREHLEAGKERADRKVLAGELNKLLERAGRTPRADVEAALEKAFRALDLPFKVRDVLAGDERWIYVTVSMLGGGSQDITLNRWDHTGWHDGGDPWPGAALAGLKKKDG